MTGAWLPGCMYGCTMLDVSDYAVQLKGVFRSQVYKRRMLDYPKFSEILGASVHNKQLIWK